MHYTTETIQILPDKPFINRTFLYLVQSLKLYNKTIVSNLEKLKVKAVGICDFNYDKNYEQNRIFILVQLNYSFRKVLTLLQEQSFFIDNYIYPHPKLKLHMIVLKLPKDIIPIFLKGDYSKMFNSEEVDIVYNKIISKAGIEYNNPIYNIVTKHPDHKKVFENELKEDFGKYIVINDDRELDYPPVLKNEIFNYDK
jgi:hypothetical protein